jgi:hypothetical protein
MSFFKSKNKQTYTLSISLKSSSIDFQLMSSTSSTKKEVLLVERSVILLENSQDPVLYTSQYIKELTLLFEKNNTKIKQITQNSPLTIHFVLWAPWFTSTISSIEHKEPTTITNDFLLKKLTQVSTDKKIYNLEKRIIKIEANGYQLDRLAKTKSSNIQLSVYTSYISEQIHTLLQDNIQKYFPLSTKISYTTSPLLILDNIKRFMIREDNVIFLNIDGEITEIGIIENDSLVYFSTFPIGIHDFLRGVQDNVRTYDYDLLYQKEFQIKSKKQELQFDILKKKWGLSVIQSLELFNKHIPNKILIITNTKTKDFFTDILLTSIKENPQNIFQNNRIINFDISLLKDIIEYKTPTGENELDLKLEALI